MKRVITTGPKLIAGLIVLLATGSLMANPLPATYVKSDVDLSTYNKVMVRPLNMDNVEVLKPAWEQGNDEVWAFYPEVQTAIQEMFLNAMKNELEANGGYELVSERGDDVMRIEVEFLSITPYLKPGTASGDSDTVISTLGSGDVVVSVEFRDSQTRELLILVEGERTIGDKYREVSPENHRKNVEGLFANWGKKIRMALDKAHNK